VTRAGVRGGKQSTNSNRGTPGESEKNKAFIFLACATREKTVGRSLLRGSGCGRLRANGGSMSPGHLKSGDSFANIGEKEFWPIFLNPGGSGHKQAKNFEESAGAGVTIVYKGWEWGKSYGTASVKPIKAQKPLALPREPWGGGKTHKALALVGVAIGGKNNRGGGPPDLTNEDSLLLQPNEKEEKLNLAHTRTVLNNRVGSTGNLGISMQLLTGNPGRYGMEKGQRQSAGDFDEKQEVLDKKDGIKADHWNETRATHIHQVYVLAGLTGQKNSK